MSDTVRVSFTVERDMDGRGQAWWALLKPRDLIIEDQGDRCYVRVSVYYWPWTPIDTGAVADLHAGAIICAGADSWGEDDLAMVHSPPLVVERGGVWEEKRYGGERWVYMRVENARPLTIEEAERLLHGSPE